LRLHWLLLPAIVVPLGAAAAFVAAAPRPLFRAGDEAELAGGDVGRGKRVFDAAACASCHASPGQGDRRVLGGGLALTSPLGTFYPPNISQDRTDGIGGWRAVDIANAVMAGVSPSGQHYYPALPYVHYARMTRGDMADLVAYLRTLPAVPGRAPPHDLAFPFSVRWGIGFWKALYFDPRPWQPDPARDGRSNRGAYLVQALAHCDECHSPHDWLAAVRQSDAFAGGIDLGGVGFVPNISPAGIGDWSEVDIVQALTTGRTPQGQRIGSSMADMVLNTAALPQTDREAIAAYIKALPPRVSPEAAKMR
jgi:mono/diheme cytochrome c family protein